MTNAQVIDAFVHQEPAYGGNLRSTGDALYSYNYRLAWRSTVGGFIWINYQDSGTTVHATNRQYDGAFSPTTSRHRNSLIRKLDARGTEHWPHTDGR